MQADFADALRHPARAAPHGLKVWNGADPTARFNVYRNNVIVSLTNALADTYPVVCELVGEAFFRAMVREYVQEHLPKSPVMSRYGGGFADWLAAFPPVARLSYLPDIARLEWARLRAYHAADCAAETPQTMARIACEPDTHLCAKVRLHPSASILQFDSPAVSLWAAHQGTGRDELAGIHLADRECALVARNNCEVVVVKVRPELMGTLHAIAACSTMMQLTSLAHVPDFAPALATLLANGALVIDGEQ